MSGLPGPEKRESHSLRVQESQYLNTVEKYGKQEDTHKEAQKGLFRQGVQLASQLITSVSYECYKEVTGVQDAPGNAE